ncbi:outer membrane lipoprotein chaperone LolA [Granulosicoccaceae sp. 1_MG-2023]|nr:outer membrane lipoprotein chaperone LolA [Granulosicoccaceae sp. 1_MG-2023]
MRKLLISFALMTPLSALAGPGMDRLEAFTDGLKTFSASFEQVVYGDNDQAVSRSGGTVAIKRPGQFVWDYRAPAKQLIVADGEKLWVYDEDLKQATVKPMDDSLGSAPIVMLTGDEPLESQFTIEELGNAEGIDWLELTSKGEDSEFRSVYLGLNKDGLAAMSLQDSFGQETQIRFSDVARNQPVDDSLFRFTPPQGTDVLGE